MTRIFVLGLILTGSLLAGPIGTQGYAEAPFVMSQVTACVHGTPNCASQTTMTPNVAVSQSGTLNVGGDSITYNDYAATQFGIMHIAAASNMTVDHNRAWALGITGFQETLTINKPGLTGTEGSLTVKYHIDGTTWSSDPSVNNAFLQVITRIWSEHDGHALQNSVQDYTAPSVDSKITIPTTFYFTYGTPFYMYFSLQATTGSFKIVPGTGGYDVNAISNGSALAAVNFHNTFVLDGLDTGVDGVTYSSGSGTMYNANGVVPEPSTLALTGMALIALGWLRRRK